MLGASVLEKRGCGRIYECLEVTLTQTVALVLGSGGPGAAFLSSQPSAGVLTPGQVGPGVMLVAAEDNKAVAMLATVV